MALKSLWVVGKSQPDECDPLFKVLRDSRYFTRDMQWQRFASALAKGNSGLAKYVRRSMSKKDQKIAKLWLNIRSNPRKVGNRKILKKNIFKAGAIFSYGINRLAWIDVDKAVKIWDSRKKEFKIETAVKQKIEQKLAISMAIEGDKRAYPRLNRLKKPSKSAKEWQVRAALKEQNWQRVQQSIARLSKKNQQEDRWLYWLARALEKKGNQKEADAIYNQLSSHRSYYGYLSANMTGKRLRIIQ